MRQVVAKSEDECRFDDNCVGAPPEAMCEPCKRRAASLAAKERQNED